MPGQHTPLFFIHVMKTAGTTFYFHLRARDGHAWVFPGALQSEKPLQQGGKLVYFETDTLLEMCPSQRMGFKAFAGHYPYVLSELLGFEVARATILRHPVERTVSFLRHAKQYMPAFRRATAEEIYDDTETFERFIHDHQTKVFAMHEGDELRSILDIVPIDADRLALAKANLAKVDLVGLQEHFDDFLDEAERRWGIERRDDIESQRVGQAPLEVGTSLRDRIAEDNAFDVEFYEFAVDLHRRRRAGEPPAPPTPARLVVRSTPDPDDPTPPHLVPTRPAPPPAERYLTIQVPRVESMALKRDTRATFRREEIYPYPDGLESRGRLVPRTDIQHLIHLPADLLDQLPVINGNFPMVVNELLPTPRITIAVLGDPVDRIIDQLRRRSVLEVYGVRQSLDEVYEEEEFFATSLHDHQAKLFAMTVDDELVTHLDVIEIDDRRVEIAKANVEAVDVLGLTEDIDALRATLVERFGWKAARPKPPPADVDAPWPSAALRRRIVEDNAADIELYEHAKALLAHRAGA